MLTHRVNKLRERLTITHGGYRFAVEFRRPAGDPGGRHEVVWLGSKPDHPPAYAVESRPDGFTFLKDGERLDGRFAFPPASAHPWMPPNPTVVIVEAPRSFGLFWEQLPPLDAGGHSPRRPASAH